MERMITLEVEVTRSVGVFPIDPVPTFSLGCMYSTYVYLSDDHYTRLAGFLNIIVGISSPPLQVWRKEDHVCVIVHTNGDMIPPGTHQFYLVPFGGRHTGVNLGAFRSSHNRVPLTCLLVWAPAANANAGAAEEDAGEGDEEGKEGAEEGAEEATAMEDDEVCPPNVLSALEVTTQEAVADAHSL